MAGPEGAAEPAPQTKAELRRLLRARRRAAAQDARRAADAAIAREVLGCRAWRQASTVYTYLSVRDEVDTRLLIERAQDEGKRVALPRVVPHTRQMRWLEVTSIDCLEVGSFGLEEPPLEGCLELDPAGEATDVALVPGLCFDDAGHRMGYGGGFYDAFLAVFRGRSLGLARPFERVGELAFLEPHDRAVDVVVSGERQ